MGRNYGMRLSRLLAIIELIGSRPGIPLKDLAAKFGLTERSIYRDLDALREAGIPCEHDPEAGGYVVRKGFFMPPIDLKFEEAMALSVLLDHVPRDGQIPFFDRARRAIEKIRSQLPESVKEDLAPLDGQVVLDLARGTTGEGVRDVYEDVREALMNRRVLRCRYDAANSSRADADETFELRPYVLLWAVRGWYVVGHHSGRDEVRHLKLNRFEHVEVTDRPYGIPDDFHLRDHLGNAWRMIRGSTRYNVAIRFDPTFADAASETRWHPTQIAEEHDDGSVTLRFEVDGLDEIAWFALSYGPGAKVIEPPELVAKVRELAEATARRYAGP